MKKSFYNMLFTFTAVGMLLFTACKKNTNSGDPVQPPAGTKNVYVAGFEINGSGKNVAKYWKNDSAVSLTDGSRDAVANAVFVSGNDIYAAGYQDKAGSILNLVSYWKNGKVYTLGITGGPFDAAYGIFVAGNDVFLAGYERAPSGNDIAKYWSNGGAVSLTDGTKDAGAFGIFIVGNDIYVAGEEKKTPTGKLIAKYWKNGVAVNLTDGTTNATALAIHVAGTDVYVAGAVDDVSGITQAVYWKNGVKQNLSAGSKNATASSIFVDGATVYAAGYNNEAAIRSGYWKTGSGFLSLLPASTYPAGEEIAGGIAVSGTDVYVAGSYKPSSNRQALYWKNGQPVYLGKINLYSSAAGIFVK